MVLYVITETHQACMVVPTCSFWTFNKCNGYMHRSTSECCGAKGTLLPQKSDWEGFQSGGLEGLGPTTPIINTSTVVTPSASSYQHSCERINVSGATLSAQCKTGQGSNKNTSILIKGISNNDGTLQFVGINIASSYQHSCENMSVSGATLTAQCKTKQGINKNTSIPIPGIHNMDGNLTY